MTAAGVVLTTGSAILFLGFFFLDLAGYPSTPQLGIITFVVPPMLFVIGLLLSPFGPWRRRWRAQTPGWPTHEFPRHRVRLVVAIPALMGVNIAILATAVSKTVEYADSTQCCTTEVR